MRRGRLVWYSHQQRTAHADSLIDFIRHARYYGLFPDRYHFNEIQELKNKLQSWDDICRFDCLLTDAYISIAHDISCGQTSAVIPNDSLILSSLEQASIHGNVMRQITQLEPAHIGYHSLKKGLRIFLDSLPESERDAVLLNSGEISEITRKTLQTVDVNLERWRLERIWEDRYILINVPAFMLYLQQGDSVMFESRVIVGAPKTPTPEITSRIECFVTYPYWHVPRKIIVEEYLPVIQKDISFLQRNHFEVLDKNGVILNPDSIDWNKFNKNYFPVKLRQREGPENSLGIIKFVFDNPFAIFLHDTNAKRLFNNDIRAFSHGCIRLEKAVELSHYLVTNDLTKKSSKVTRFLREQSRNIIELYNPIPIYVRYYTCDFSNSRLNIYKDIYAKDNLLAGKLYLSPVKKL